MYGDGTVAEGPVADWAETPREAATRHLRYAAWLVAQRDEAGAAGYVELALPYLAAHMTTWGRKAGRKPKPPGMTVDEQRLDMLERGMPMEQIAEIEGFDLDVIRRSLDRGRKRRGQ